MKLLLTSLLLGGCGIQTPDFIQGGKAAGKFFTISPSFSSHYTKFEAETGVRPDIPIGWGVDMDNELAGVCSVYDSGHREIAINRKIWATLSSAQRTILIAHELGHCLWDRVHLDTHRENNLPTSFMNTYLPMLGIDKMMMRDKAFYYNELIHK